MAGREITMESLLNKLDKMETEMNKTKEVERQLIEKNEEMQSEMLSFIVDLLPLKRLKMNVYNEQKENKREIQELKSQIDDLKSALNTQPPAQGLSRKEARIIVKQMETFGHAINTLTDRFNTGMDNMHQLEERVEQLLRVYNRGQASFQATKDLVEEVSRLETEINTLKIKAQHQQQQQKLLKSQQESPEQYQQIQQQQEQSVYSLPSSTPETAPPPLPPKIPLTRDLAPQKSNSSATWISQKLQGLNVSRASTQRPKEAAPPPPSSRLRSKAFFHPKSPKSWKSPFVFGTSHQQQKLKKTQDNSRFNVFSPCSIGSLQTGQRIFVKEYCGIITDSLNMNMETGVYETPIKGKYRFGGVMAQHGNGKIRLFICEDDEGKRELLGTTDGDGIRRDLDVTWECKKGVGVWLEIERIEGEAGLWDCRFHGRLLLN